MSSTPASLDAVDRLLALLEKQAAERAAVVPPTHPCAACGHAPPEPQRPTAHLGDETLVSENTVDRAAAPFMRCALSAAWASVWMPTMPSVWNLDLSLDYDAYTKQAADYRLATLRRRAQRLKEVCVAAESALAASIWTKREAPVFIESAVRGVFQGAIERWNDTHARGFRPDAAIEPPALKMSTLEMPSDKTLRCVAEARAGVKGAKEELKERVAALDRLVDEFNKKLGIDVQACRRALHPPSAKTDDEE